MMSLKLSSKAEAIWSRKFTKLKSLLKVRGLKELLLAKGKKMNRNNRWRLNCPDLTVNSTH
jgi:hypothetical protein